MLQSAAFVATTHQQPSCTLDQEDENIVPFLSNPVYIALVWIILYGIIFIYSCMVMDTLSLALSGVIVLIQVFSNWEALFFQSRMKEDEGSTTRLVLSLFLLSVRFLLFPRNKHLLLALIITWIFILNRASKQVVFRGELYTICLGMLFIGNGLYVSVLEFCQSGWSEAWITMVCEELALPFSMIIYTHYFTFTSHRLQRKIAELENIRKDLQRSLSTTDRIFAHISHEFRCPIMSSMGSLEMLQETNLDEKQKEMVHTIMTSNSILLMLIEDILQLIKIDHENKQDDTLNNEITKETFCLATCFTSLQSIVQGYANLFSVNVEFHVDETIRNTNVISNMSRIHQVLSNLITNAVKASPKNEKVEVYCEISDVQQNDKAIITMKVKDYGCGIPKSKISSIFEPFVQAHNVNESNIPSSGLGLTTVLQIVKSMGGNIDVESEEGKGSTFTVTIPVIVTREPTEKLMRTDSRAQLQLKAQQQYLSMVSEEQTRQPSSEEKKANVIVAEDNAINRKVIVKLIENLGFKADFVSNGQELVDNFNIEKHKIVITDLNMPIMNGMEAAKQLRAKYGKDIKIYLLTGNVLVKRAYDSQEFSIIDGVLTKPCTKQDLFNCLNIS